MLDWIGRAAPVVRPLVHMIKLGKHRGNKPPGNLENVAPTERRPFALVLVQTQSRVSSVKPLALGKTSKGPRDSTLVRVVTWAQRHDEAAGGAPRTGGPP